jgi:DNA-binding NarL/FixJ family response regulator
MEHLLNAICTGASAYLLKGTREAPLLDSSPELARRVITLLRQPGPTEQGSCRLTPQESELLKLMVEGHHLRNIYDKLQVHSKTEAVAKALRERLVV